MPMNRRVILKQRPKGTPQKSDFAWVDEPIPELGDNQILIKNTYCSLDPAIRGWLDDAESYFPPIGLGQPIRASTTGRVAATSCKDFAVGDYVVGLNAVELYSVAENVGFTSKVDRNAVASMTNYLSVFGAVGMTAYFAVIDKCKPQPGETVLVSGAAGAVGSLVGQMAKLYGARAIGIAGGADKCRRLTEEFGFDAAIDYRGKDSEQLSREIKALSPGGIDVYFDNVGGTVLEAALDTIKDGARILLCGMISQYNATEKTPGPSNLWQMIAHPSTMHGFIVRDYVPRFGEGIAAMMTWVNEGKLTFREHIDEGIDNFHQSFMRLFDGSNDGKLILKIGED